MTSKAKLENENEQKKKRRKEEYKRRKKKQKRKKERKSEKKIRIFLVIRYGATWGKLETQTKIK